MSRSIPFEMLPARRGPVSSADIQRVCDWLALREFVNQTEDAYAPAVRALLSGYEAAIGAIASAVDLIDEGKPLTAAQVLSEAMETP